MAGHVEGDVGGQGALAHGGAGGEDHQVRRVQAAQHLVEIDEAGAEAGHAAVARIGLGGHVDGAADGVGERDEAAGGRAGLGQGIELLFGGLDLVAGGAVGVDHRLVGDIAADADQLAAQGQVVDHPGIVDDIGRRRGPVDQVGQIAQAAQLLEGGIAAEAFHEHDRLGQLALADVLLHGGEQPGVERLVEVVGLEVVAQAFIGGVVVEDRPQQGLFGLDVGGGVGRGRVDGSQVEGRGEGHGLIIA